MQDSSEIRAAHADLRRERADNHAWHATNGLVEASREINQLRATLGAAECRNARAEQDFTEYKRYVSRRNEYERRELLAVISSFRIRAETLEGERDKLREQLRNTLWEQGIRDLERQLKWFMVDNITRDGFLLQNLDREGWASVDLLLTFPTIMRITSKFRNPRTALQAAARQSPCVDLREDGNAVRACLMPQYDRK